jgi:chaperonin cofactor prefoldin
MSLWIPVSCGELLDKMTILLIKKEKIENPQKLENIIKELDQLTEVYDEKIGKSDELESVITELRKVNETLWQIEDDIRACERQQDFGERFIELARSVYRTNDRRAALKYTINSLVGSALVEEKSYEEY